MKRNTVGSSALSPAWRRFRNNRRGFVSFILLSLIYALSLVAELICSENPVELLPGIKLEAPFKSGPHTVFPTSVLDPYLRVERLSAGEYPCMAADVNGDLSVFRIYGRTNEVLFAGLSHIPEALKTAVASRLANESAPAAEVCEGGISYRLAPFTSRAIAPSTVRLYLRYADWRTRPAEIDGSKELSMVPEQATFPFRPIPGHPFGFDAAGRDVFARVLYGTRTAITFGLVLTLASLLLGTLAGAVQGFFASWVDIAGQRLTEIWSAIPFLYVMIFLGNAFGRSFGLLLFCYAIFNWIGVAAYVRAEFLRLRMRAFVDAARCQGLSSWRIMFRHILPNALTPLITLFPLLLVGAIGSLAALDYLGFGLPDGAPSWGELLGEAQSFRGAWWLVLYPSLALFVVILLGVFVGEALRDAFDPTKSSVRRARSRSGRVEPCAASAVARNADFDGDVAVSGAPVLELDALKVVFDTPEGELTAVDGVSLAIGRGETLGIVGESGCGKSVSAMSILQLVPSPPGRVVAGDIRIKGCSVLAMAPSKLRAIRGKEVGMVFQDPMTSLSPLCKIGDQMLETLRLHGKVKRREGLEIAAKWLFRCGIQDPWRCLAEYPFRLSGGMQQRVMIAMALMNNPSLVIADEPTTSLDVTVQAQVLDLMREVRSADTALLLITHNMAVVKQSCSRVAVMYAGRIVETGKVDEVFAHPRHPYTRALLNAMPSSHKPGERLPEIQGSLPSPLSLPDGCRFAPRCPLASDRCRTTSPLLAPLQSRSSVAECHSVACHVAELDVPANTVGEINRVSLENAPVILECCNLTKQYPRVRAVDAVSLDLRKGEILAIVGESGSGKTTLARMIAGLEKPTMGELRINGAVVGARRSTEARRALQMVFQDPFSSLNPRRRINSLLTEGAVVSGIIAPRDRDKEAARLLAMVNMPPDAAWRYPHEFSGGQLQRISIARALSVRPDIVICDEPVSALDVSVQAHILNLLSDIRSRLGTAYIFITHDLGVVRSIADRIAVMHNGRIVESGVAQQVLTAPAHPYTRTLLASEPRVER